MKFIVIFFFIFSLNDSYSCDQTNLLDLSELGDITPVMIEVLKQQINEVKRPKPPRCPSLEEVKNQKQIVFNFEGTGGYAPKGFYMDQFITRSELTGKWELKEACKSIGVERKCIELLEEDISETVLALPLSRKLMIPFHKDERNTLLYYSHTHLKHSMRCLTGLINQSRNENIDLPPIKIMGYSWGGNTAMKFVKKLNKKFPDTKIAKVFTVDPVRKGLGVLKNLFGSKDSKYFEKESNTGEHYNIFQKTDTSSMLVGIKGNVVKGADKNINYISILSEFVASYGHVALPESIQAKSLMEEFMEVRGD
jgi:hypothetical protein